MDKITRYVSRTVFTAIALTLLVFLALDFIFGLISQLEKVTENYTAFEAFKYMVFTMPRRLYDYIPYSCLIGCLAGLGLLASSSELTIIRAAGVSVKRIAWMALRPALVFILIAMTVGEFVAPYTEQMADNRRNFLRHNAMQKAPQNMWNREGSEFMYVNAVLPNGVVYGLTRYQFNDQHQLESASFTRQATYQDNVWQEEDISITYLAGDSIRNEVIPSRRWETNLTPNLFNILVLAPEDISLRNLHYYIDYLNKQNLTSSSYSLAFWQKTLQPLATAALVLVAISFIFGPLRSVTMGQRIFTGVVFGIVFLLMQNLLGPSSLVFGFPPLIAVMIPIVLCVSLGIYLLNRAR
ncbi:LPS export ABC transporter permease LptG [Cellvibrio sp. KY-GH-1]|uniref:LPS export ABC transporter permease LptG n=1 Tax=Cellvibrio sp. KY-GH-1 TaxID=2303332 RepID=UPI001246A439|nr:LPS export ABC transporter permease LptG [Cellvibrio sp. KY-GH-1]QEY15397.1 LPS export ABC transporter permease LptG [Cellvibrio sp. KY-GH-1]